MCLESKKCKKKTKQIIFKKCLSLLDSQRRFRNNNDNKKNKWGKKTKQNKTKQSKKKKTYNMGHWE